MKLAIDSREQRGVVILQIHGRLVMGDEVRQFREEVTNLLSAQKRRIILNMTDVPYVDSSGIGALVEAVVLAATEGGRVKLAGLQRMVSSALTLHKLTPAFQIFPGEEEALASFETSSGGTAPGPPQS